MKQNQRKLKRLKELLEIKKDETPPAEYFQHFSDRVISRIEEQSTHGVRRTWISLLKEYDVKPILSCAYGFAIGGLLLLGFQLSKMMETDLATPAVDDLSWPTLSTLTGQFDIQDNLEAFQYPSSENLHLISPISPVVFSRSVAPVYRHSPPRNPNFFME